jgi:hypothetical protein
MNTSKFDNLHDLTCRNRQYVASSLSGKNGITSFNLNNGESIHHAIHWHADDWLRDAARLSWCDDVLREMDEAIQRNLNFVIYDQDNQLFPEEFEAAMEVEARKIKAHYIALGLDAVWRGVEHSSNQMTILETEAKVNAAKWMLENLFGFSCNSFTHPHAIEDFLAGQERRADARRAKMAATPQSVVWFKQSGHYFVKVLNELREPIGQPTKLHATNKSGAKGEAHGIARGLSDLHGVELHNIAVREG